MKIVSGSFGIKGKARIVAGALRVTGARSNMYSPANIAAISASVERERGFGLGGCLLGCLLFGGLGAAAFGVIGLAGGMLLSILGSFYSRKRNLVHIDFDDGQQLALECSGAGVKRLMAFAGTA